MSDAPATPAPHPRRDDVASSFHEVLVESEARSLPSLLDALATAADAALPGGWQPAGHARTGDLGLRMHRFVHDDGEELQRWRGSFRIFSAPTTD